MSALDEKVKAFLSVSYGSGYGSGIRSCNGELVYNIDGVPTILRHVRRNVAHGVVLNRDLTTTDCYVAKQDNIFAHGETLAKAMEALRDKLFGDMPVEERIEAFLKETEDGKAYPAQYFYDWHHRLTGSCDMGRRQFARDHGIDVDSDTMTLREFLALTKDAYGGSVIRKAMENLEVVYERTYPQTTHRLVHLPPLRHGQRRAQGIRQRPPALLRPLRRLRLHRLR